MTNLQSILLFTINISIFPEDYTVINYLKD